MVVAVVYLEKEGDERSGGCWEILGDEDISSFLKKGSDDGSSG